MEERLLEEYRDLNKKIGVLENFIKKDSFHDLEEQQQKLLEEQLEVMTHYSGILSTRLLLLMIRRK